MSGMVTKSLVILLLLFPAIIALPPPLAVYKKPQPTDEKCLAWVLYSESRGESLKGARAVLDVVLQRMRTRRQTACQVVSSPKQFSGYHKGVFEKVSKQALTRYETVRIMSPVAKNCEYFHATYVEPDWVSRMIPCKKIGNHIFYKPIKENTHEKSTSSNRH